MWKNWEHKITPDCGYDNKTINPIRDVYCPDTKCSVNFACTKRLFNLSAEAISNAVMRSLYARCAVFLLKIKQIPFFVVWSRVYFFKESPKSVQDVIGDVYCPGKYCFNREKCESLDGYVTTPRSIYGVESVEPGCLFTKSLLCYKST